MPREEVVGTISSKKKIVLPIVLLLAIVSGIYIFMQSGKDKDSITLYGNVDIRQISLAFNGSERIASMLVEEGDVVKKDQLLATLDTEKLALQIDKVKAQIEVQENVVLRLKNGSRAEEIAQQLARLNAARAEEEYARQQLQRVETVFQNSLGRSVSQQDKDDAQAKVKVASAQTKDAQEAYQLAKIGPRAEDIAEAQAQLKTLKAELAMQEYLLSQSQLKAPADAVVRSRLVEPGDMASPQRAVYLLAVNDTKWIRAYIQEAQLGKVHPGMEVDIVIDSYPDRPIRGQVGFISSVAEFTPKTVQTEELRTSLLYEIRVYVKDQDNVLRLGMPATVIIHNVGKGKV